MHLNSPPIGIVGGNLPVVDDGVVKHRKGMGPAPPAGGIGGIPSVGRPAVALVLLQPVEIPYIFRKAHCFEDAHVFAAGKDIGAVDMGVDADDALGDKFPLVKLARLELCGKRIEEIPPDERFVFDFRSLPSRDFRQVHDIKMLFQKTFAFLTCLQSVIKHMECIILFIFRINTVSCKAASQSIAAVVHYRNGLYRFKSGKSLSVSGKNAGNGTTRRDAYLSFL